MDGLVPDRAHFFVRRQSSIGGINGGHHTAHGSGGATIGGFFWASI
jgi:hypothetical protein